MGKKRKKDTFDGLLSAVELGELIDEDLFAEYSTHPTRRRIWVRAGELERLWGEERGRRNPRTVAEARLGMTETTTLWIEEKKRGKFWFFVFFSFSFGQMRDGIFILFDLKILFLFDKILKYIPSIFFFFSKWKMFKHFYVISRKLSNQL